VDSLGSTLIQSLVGGTGRKSRAAMHVRTADSATNRNGRMSRRGIERTRSEEEESDGARGAAVPAWISCCTCLIVCGKEVVGPIGLVVTSLTFPFVSPVTRSEDMRTIAPTR
jgi:hypothetical protein